MKLTIEEHPERIKRYGHVKPARSGRVRLCSARCPGTPRTCTLEIGHSGPHVAHGRFRRVMAVWDGGAADATARRSGASGGPGSRMERSTGKPRGMLEVLRDRLLSVGSSVETVIFLVMLLAFLGFAIHWFLLFAGALG